MNDPEIIRKLEEIREELSGIKHGVSYIREFYCMVVGLHLAAILLVVILWIMDFLF